MEVISRKGDKGMKQTGAVLLAAGLSSRMGAFKPMLPFGGDTISRQVVSTLLQLGVDPVVVVTGFRANELEEHLRPLGVRFVRNERYRETQMFDCVKLGMEAAVRECGRVMVMPMDIPAVRPDTIAGLLNMDAEVVYPVCRGIPGHPLVMERRIAAAVCGDNGDGGLWEAVKRTKAVILELETKDEGILKDVDTQREYRDLIQWNHARQSIGNR